MLRILLIIILTCTSATLTAKPLTVVLDWFANPDHAPIFVAKQQGYFKKMGVSVNIITPSNPNDPPKLIAAKKADIALTYQPQFMLDVAQGLPLVRIGTLIATPLTCLVVLKKSGITNIHQLKGKTIAGTPNDVILNSMLKANGLKPNDVKIVNVQYNLVQALLSHKVVAAAGMYRNVELLQLQRMHHPSLAFYPEENGIPPYNELIYITHRDEIHDPRLVKFLQAVTLGVQYLVNHPQSTWQTFAKNHPEANNPLNKASWFASLSRFALRPMALDKNRFRRFALFMKKQRQIKQLPPLNRYAVALSS